MHILYPDIKPFQTQMLPVSDGHVIYLEQSGNAEGIPVLFVHGGPGAGCHRQDRSFFDPERYRIILFDQRGCGRSEPHTSLEHNTTQTLIADMEAIRLHLGIERWVLFGGSWGSTLSLVYAQTYPRRVMGMILRGVFLCRADDIGWFYQSGASRIFPDYWEDFVHPIPESEHGNLLAAYHKRLTGSNELAKMSCAKAWALWEAHCATLRPNLDVLEAFSDPHLALAMACIEAHYFMHAGFLEENQILNHAADLDGIPGIIVHGRYDMICPLDNAQSLHHVWHDSELHIIRDAGHSACEPSIVDALIRATRAMARRFAHDYPTGA
ncbi:prolyl aminopeptidase [Aestuariicella hydrocarbonica]|uniref:Proline iminopeptidase n=1 Tax=Pseudomaricurvus hydrocarbonicus TaxID=1470433 RepID=A0A9E5MPN7_9GAMM|nr:prolyl aminopeptidase [Aestuariicella hydrocarbonica]NHO68080.1 prolyl aminopeptidase [Aestuariicella hydrocarbonica]